MEPEKTLDETREYLKEWLERNEQNQAFVPAVTNELEWIEWKIQALSILKNFPTTAGNAMPAAFNERVEQNYSYIKSDLPQLPEYKPSTLNGLASIGTATASEIYAFVSQPNVPIKSRVHFTPHLVAYQQIQQKQNRPREVRQRIKEVGFPQLENRFEKAQTAYNAFKGGTVGNSATASEIRNLLYSLNHYLLVKAREKPREQKLSWDEYARRLVPYINPPHLYYTFVQQGEVYKELQQLVSEGGKDRSPIDIESVWTRVLDHIFVVLGLVKL